MGFGFVKEAARHRGGKYKRTFRKEFLRFLSFYDQQIKLKQKFKVVLFTISRTTPVFNTLILIHSARNQHKLLVQQMLKY